MKSSPGNFRSTSSVSPGWELTDFRGVFTSPGHACRKVASQCGHLQRRYSSMSKVPPLEASVTVTARDAILQQATEFSHLQWCLT